MGILLPGWHVTAWNLQHASSFDSLFWGWVLSRLFFFFWNCCSCLVALSGVGSISEKIALFYTYICKGWWNPADLQCEPVGLPHLVRLLVELKAQFTHAHRRLSCCSFQGQIPFAEFLQLLMIQGKKFGKSYRTNGLDVRATTPHWTRKWNGSTVNTTPVVKTTWCDQRLFAHHKLSRPPLSDNIWSQLLEITDFWPRKSLYFELKVRHAVCRPFILMLLCQVYTKHGMTGPRHAFFNFLFSRITCKWRSPLLSSLTWFHHINGV